MKSISSNIKTLGHFIGKPKFYHDLYDDKICWKSSFHEVNPFERMDHWDILMLHDNSNNQLSCLYKNELSSKEKETANSTIRH